MKPTPKCIYCQSPKAVQGHLPPTHFNRKVFQYLRCLDCGLLYIDPLLSLEDYRALYPLDYHGGGPQEAPAEMKDYASQFKLLAQIGTGKQLLDYGCGNGAFIKEAAVAGLSCEGAEYNPDLVVKLATQFPQAAFTTIEACLKDRNPRYDLIHLGDVLEHLINPRATLQELLGLLNPGGKLMVEGPLEENTSLARAVRVGALKFKRKLKPQWSVSHPPYHVSFTNRTNQEALFLSLGLKTLHFEVSEHPWPFPCELKRGQGAKQVIQFFIGAISKELSRGVKSWGNRFIYLGSA